MVSGLTPGQLEERERCALCCEALADAAYERWAVLGGHDGGPADELAVSGALRAAAADVRTGGQSAAVQEMGTRTAALLAEVERLRAASDEQAREWQAEVGRLRTVLRAVLEGCRCGLGGLQGDALRATEALQGPPFPSLLRVIDEERERRAVDAILDEGRQ